MTRIQRRLLIDTSILGVALTLFVAILDASTRALQPLDDWFYDRRAHLCQNFTPPPTDKLIHVDIDDRSLATLGKWPWSGTTLAHLIDEIDRAGPKAIAMDIIFSEPDEIEAVPVDPNERPEDRLERDLRRFLAVFPRPVRESTSELQINLPDLFKSFWKDPGPRTIPVDHDANFAAALARSGKALVPVSLTLPNTPPPLQVKIREFLTADLELTEAQVYQRLLNDPSKPLPQGAPFPTDTFLMARREAMNTRITTELQRGPRPLEHLRRSLLPKFEPDFGGAPLLRLLSEEYRRVQAVAPLRRFVLPDIPDLPPLAKFAGELAPIPPLSRAAAFSGYVDYVQTNERGVVRSIPLVAEYRGQLFPQMDLVLACAVLGVDVKTVKLHPDKVVIPRPPGRGRDIVIPVRDVYATIYGRDVGLMMDIPVRGRRAWETIYDHRRHAQPANHLPIAYIWEVHTFRTGIEKNNLNIDRALRAILDEDTPADSPELPRLGLDPDQYNQYEAVQLHADEFNERKQRAQATLNLMKEFGYDKPLADADLPRIPGTDKPDPREKAKRDEVAAARKTLERAVEQNDRFVRILAQRRAELRQKIAGRAVMIGWTGSGGIDFFPTAIQPASPGAVIHGLAYNAIMTGEFWRHAPHWVTFLITLLIGLAVTAANGLLKPSAALGVALLLAAVYLLLNGILLFDYANLCVGVAGPIVALASVWSTGALAGFLIEAAERRNITKRFSTYTDPKLVDFVIENPNAVLDGQVREMSVIFTDLAGFTQLTEQLREDSVPIVSEYLGRMVPIIRRNDGYVNKFLGDGIMCFFNAPRDDPDHAGHAVQSCLAMQREMKAFADELLKRGLPQLAMRCGVSTGTMVVGDSGPADAADYTVLGDNVNFASRLESANKVTGTSILISHRTVELLADRFLVRPVGKLQVVGKTEGVMTYEPLAPLDDATPDQRVLCSISAEIVAAYVASDFQRCLKIADQMDQQFGPTKLAHLYRRTSTQYLQTPPPPDFTGNLILTEK